MTDALEEVTDNHLGTHQREGGYYEVESADGLLGQFGAGTEDVYHRGRYQLACQEGRKGDAGCPDYAVTQHLEDAVVLLGPPVVADDGLHSLYKSHYDGNEQEHYPVDDAVCSNRHIAAILEQAVVAYQHNQAGATVEQEGAKAYCKALSHDVEPQPVDASAKMKQFCRTVEEPKLPAESDGLCNDGGPGNALNAPMEHEDKEGVEYAVDDDGEERTAHCRTRVAGTTQYGIRTIIQVRYHVAQQNDEHVLASVG